MTPRDRTAITVMLDAGLRASEACALTWDDIDDVAATIRVRNGKGGKGRVVPVHPATVAQLLRDRPLRPLPLPGLGRPGGPSDAPQPAPVIYRAATPDKPITRSMLHRIVRAAGEAIGVHCWPHMLRHTYACHCLRLGLSVYDLMHLLGHDRLETTVIYLHLQPDELAERVRAAFGGQLAANMRLSLEAAR